MSRPRRHLQRPRRQFCRNCCAWPTAQARPSARVRLRPTRRPRRARALGPVASPRSPSRPAAGTGHRSGSVSVPASTTGRLFLISVASQRRRCPLGPRDHPRVPVPIPGVLCGTRTRSVPVRRPREAPVRMLLVVRGHHRLQVRHHLCEHCEHALPAVVVEAGLHEHRQAHRHTGSSYLVADVDVHAHRVQVSSACHYLIDVQRYDSVPLLTSCISAPSIVASGAGIVLLRLEPPTVAQHDAPGHYSAQRTGQLSAISAPDARAVGGVRDDIAGGRGWVLDRRHASRSRSTWPPPASNPFFFSTIFKAIREQHALGSNRLGQGTHERRAAPRRTRPRNRR